jgi:hypothetical protein
MHFSCSYRAAGSLWKLLPPSVRPSRRNTERCAPAEQKRRTCALIKASPAALFASCMCISENCTLDFASCGCLDGVDLRSRPSGTNALLFLAHLINDARRALFLVIIAANNNSSSTTTGPENETSSERWALATRGAVVCE